MADDHRSLVLLLCMHSTYLYYLYYSFERAAGGGGPPVVMLLWTQPLIAIEPAAVWSCRASAGSSMALLELRQPTSVRIWENILELCGEAVKFGSSDMEVDLI